MKKRWGGRDLNRNRKMKWSLGEEVCVIAGFRLGKERIDLGLVSGYVKGRSLIRELFVLMCLTIVD